MRPFNMTTYTTGAHLVMTAVVGTRKNSGIGGSGASTTWEFRMPLLSRFACTLFLGGCLSYRFASSVLYRFVVPFRRCGGGQERTPLVLLFLRHYASELGMQVRSLFLILAPERNEGTIEIHRREGEQAQEGFRVDQ